MTSSRAVQPTDADIAAAEYLAKFLETRSGGELQEAIEAISLGSYRRMVEEISWIIANRGKPPNWV